MGAEWDSSIPLHKVKFPENAMSVSLKKRLVEQSIRDLVRYAAPKNRPVRPKHRKMAAEALAFLLSDSCKSICKELEVDWDQTVKSLIHCYARRTGTERGLQWQNRIS
jgi:hypothetical protein